MVCKSFREGSRPTFFYGQHLLCRIKQVVNKGHVGATFGRLNKAARIYRPRILWLRRGECEMCSVSITSRLFPLNQIVAIKLNFGTD